MDRCRSDEPPLTALASEPPSIAARKVACWLHDVGGTLAVPDATDVALAMRSTS
jgi:hypothetical protein